jgi:hypothetical protein
LGDDDDDDDDGWAEFQRMHTPALSTQQAPAQSDHDTPAPPIETITPAEEKKRVFSSHNSNILGFPYGKHAPAGSLDHTLYLHGEAWKELWERLEALERKNEILGLARGTVGPLAHQIK